MTTFNDLDFKPFRDGVQATIFFPNGYGASTVQHHFSYGGDQGLYELAVLKGTEEEWDLTYNTPVTDDVEGNLDHDAVTKLLEQIEQLEGK